MPTPKHTLLVAGQLNLLLEYSLIAEFDKETYLAHIKSNLERGSLKQLHFIFSLVVDKKSDVHMVFGYYKNEAAMGKAASMLEMLAEFRRDSEAMDDRFNRGIFKELKYYEFLLSSSHSKLVGGLHGTDKLLNTFFFAPMTRKLIKRLESFNFIQTTPEEEEYEWANEWGSYNGDSSHRF